jgi:hypothetical protein
MFFLILFCINSFIAPVSAWIFLDDFDQFPHYAIKTIASGQAIEYCIDFYHENIRDPHIYITESFKAWDKKLNKNPVVRENCQNPNSISVSYVYTHTTGPYYNKSNRERTTLTRHIIPTTIVSDDTLGVFHRGAYSSSKKPHIIINLTKIEEQLAQTSLSKEELIKRVMIHEVGHVLGLKDQYGGREPKTVYDRKLKSDEESIMKDIIKVAEPTMDDLMGLTVLYSRYKNDHLRYASFIEGETGNYINGLREGSWSIKSKATLTELYYLRGLKKGIETVYDISNGTKRIYIKTTYLNGKMDGAHEMYYPNGTLALKGSYKEDKPSGRWIYGDGRCIEHDPTTDSSKECKK